MSHQARRNDICHLSSSAAEKFHSKYTFIVSGKSIHKGDDRNPTISVVETFRALHSVTFALRTWYINYLQATTEDR